MRSAFADDLFEKAGAARWLSRDEFAEAIARSLKKGLGVEHPAGSEVRRYLAGLHAADLALASACALGHDAAWDHFVLEHRPVLYRAADALDPTGGARELADGLYADLYGIRDGEGRGSLLLYYHGRSSLATWLRAVLSQRYVDRLRAERRIDPLPDEDASPARIDRDQQDPDRTRLLPLVEDAIRSAIATLDARDRLRLRSYHVAGMTLAQIGRLTGEHEATVSRQLSRIRKELRRAAEAALRSAPLTPAQIDRAFQLSVEDPGRLDLQQLFEGAKERKNPAAERSK